MNKTYLLYGYANKISFRTTDLLPIDNRQQRFTFLDDDDDDGHYKIYIYLYVIIIIVNQKLLYLYFDCIEALHTG